MSRVGGQSEPNLAEAVRREARAASEAASSIRSGHRHRRHRSGSEADLQSRSSYKSGRSRRSRGSMSYASSYYEEEEEGLTLEEQQKRVQDEAFHRHVQKLEREAKEAVRDAKQWTMTVQTCKDEEADEIRKRREMEKKNQEGVRLQMENNKAKRAMMRKEHIEAASSHSFPLFTETFIDEEAYERIRKQQKELWRAELDDQTTMVKMLRNIEEKKLQDHAAKQRMETMKNMTLNRGVEKQRQKGLGREMVNSWERDCRLKALQKQMRLGNDVVAEVQKHYKPT